MLNIIRKKPKMNADALRNAAYDAPQESGGSALKNSRMAVNNDRQNVVLNHQN